MHNRLPQVAGMMARISNRYDKDGLPLEVTREDGSTAQAEYDDQDKLVSYGGRDYTHDARGRVTGWSAGAQTTQLEWDDDDRLVATTLPSGQRISHRFDVAGRRATLSIDGTTQHKLLFNGLQLIAKQDPSGTLTQRYVYATHSHVPDLILHQSEWYRVIKDVRGSVRLVVHATDGTVAQRLDYDEFGRVTADSSPDFQPFGFAGGLYDHRSGLVLFGYRVYDPFTGRFLTRDPLWHGGGHSNLYLYVANDPVNFIDPDGLFAWLTIPFILKTFAVVSAGSAVVALASKSKDGAPSNVAGKIWGLPNTAVGLTWGIIGTLINSSVYDMGTHWEIENNSISIYNHPIQRGKGSITLGNAICFYDEKSNLSQKHINHERQHTYQNEKLGQYYLPLHFISGTLSSIFNPNSLDPWHAANLLESGPSNNPQSPWPW